MSKKCKRNQYQGVTPEGNSLACVMSPSNGSKLRFAPEGRVLLREKKELAIKYGEAVQEPNDP